LGGCRRREREAGTGGLIADHGTRARLPDIRNEMAHLRELIATGFLARASHVPTCRWEVGLEHRVASVAGLQIDSCAGFLNRRVRSDLPGTDEGGHLF
jgi:hypothetical protein